MVEGDRKIGFAPGLKRKDGPKFTRGEVLRPIDQDLSDVLEVLRKRGSFLNNSMELALIGIPVLASRSEVPLS
jgi:hypothetical protein